MDAREQPILTDGDLILRPWRLEDVESARLQHDAEMARWFDFPTVVPSAEHHESWVRRTHEEWRDGRAKVTFALDWRGQVAGSVDVRTSDPGVGVLSWAVYAAHRGNRLATRAVRMLADFAFTELDHRRVEAHVNPRNHASVRTALRAGLRREGLLRSNTTLNGQPQDTVVLGRLREDAAPGSRLGFTAVLDSALPLKRAIAQGVLRDPEGRVLLCELVYKPEWDLPGGVVDPGESPAACVVREVREELGIDVTVRRLLAVDWLPPWLGWRDAVLFVFDLGTAPVDLTTSAVLEPREIAGLHWADAGLTRERVAAYTARLIEAVPPAGEGTRYLEDGRPL